jgi:hypothetical protein
MSNMKARAPASCTSKLKIRENMPYPPRSAEDNRKASCEHEAQHQQPSFLVTGFGSRREGVHVAANDEQSDRNTQRQK